jgi:peptidoglycan hydrolase-like protein with peptidoglycan-binding domain
MAYENGKYPQSALATTYLYYPNSRNGRQLTKEAAIYAEALATAFYLEFGKPLMATDGYRSRAEQERLYQPPPVGVGPGLAAVPGTSNHGYGEALDLSSNVNSFSSAEHRWMVQNGPKFGWVHPYWARKGGGREEPWHFEFVGPTGKTGPRVRHPKRGEIGIGQVGAKPRHVQNLLNKIGAPKYRVTADGVYGLGTAIAVMKYQWVKGLPGTGVVDALTLKHLEGKVRPKPPVSKATRDQIIRIQNVVKARKTGKWDRDTEKRLWAVRQASEFGGHRFPYGVDYTQRVVGTPDDGVWGNGSGRAHTTIVQRLQAVLGLRTTGVFDQKLRDALVTLQRKAQS